MSDYKSCSECGGFYRADRPRPCKCGDEVHRAELHSFLDRVALSAMDREVSGFSAEDTEVSRLQMCLSVAEAERDKLRAALEAVLPMAEALHRRNYGNKRCDHDEFCHCDAEAKSLAAIRLALEALGRSK